ncbi:transcription factor IIE [Planoprotostelium fungivorum]|uniref:Transcription factor IIE n=1 Tax=Planoprotostelium fungivorum TaxID=1890364 RepID=A0A2P6MQ64_9EUKA|nr:transcription factor IIE [Planoprotostelium fungivorum]
MGSVDYVILNDLMRLVLRAFYSDEQEIAVEELIRKSNNGINPEATSVSAPEMARRLKVGEKQVRRWMGALKADSIIAFTNKRPEDTKNELGETVQGKKWLITEFWYIDYKRFVDVVKYRIHLMQQRIYEDAGNELRNQRYVCPKCKNAKYTALDAARLMNIELNIFQCEKCKSELTEEDNSVRVTMAEEKKSKLMDQLKMIITQLKLVEPMVIPRRDDPTKITTPETAQERSGTRKTTSQSNRLTVSIDTGNNADGASSEKERASKPGQGTEIIMDEQTSKQKVNLPWLPTHNKPSAVAVGEIVPEEAAPKAEEFINTDAYYHEFMKKNETPASTGANVEEYEEETVTVGDRVIPLSEVTQEDIEQMNEAESADYLEKFRRANGEY